MITIPHVSGRLVREIVPSLGSKVNDPMRSSGMRARLRIRREIPRNRFCLFTGSSGSESHDSTSGFPLSMNSSRIYPAGKS